MKKISMFIFLMFIISPFAFPADPKGACTVTYIANEGFLIETKNHKVLIDGLFGNIKGNWCEQPTDSILKLMINGSAPFDNIDVVLVTHKHIDHFNASMVADFLLNNQKAVLICPVQAGELLKGNPGYSKISGRILSLQSKDRFDSTLIVNKIKVEVLRFNHGSYIEKDTVTGISRDRHKDVENFGYIIEPDGFSIFHSGDASFSDKSHFGSYDFGKRSFDIAFLDRSFLRKEGQELMNEFIHTSNLIFMHCEPGKEDYYKTIIKSIPEMFVFKKPLEKKVINK